MVSPEVLRRFPFFGFMTHAQLQEVAMIAEEVELDAEEVLFSMGAKADALYLLTKGAVDLHYVVVDENLPQLKKDFMVGSVNPGEIVGVSAVIEPYELTATAIATKPSELLRIDGEELHQLLEEDHDLAYGFQKQVAKSTMERLHATRVLLAAATSPPPRERGRR